MSNEPFPVIRSHLYGPGNNAKILSKIFDTESDAVILDLEDAVPPNQKELARNMVAEIISERSQESQPYCFVRINHPSLQLVELEIRAITQKGLFGIRIPKVETPDDIIVVEKVLNEEEQNKSLQNGSIKIICNIINAIVLKNRIKGFLRCTGNFITLTLFFLTYLIKGPPLVTMIDLQFFSARK